MISEIKIKPLEWVTDWGGSYDDIPEWRADTPLGRLCASVAGYRNAVGNQYENHQSVPESLKQKLISEQTAHYEQRIRSALVTPTDAGKVERVEAQPIGDNHPDALAVDRFAAVMKAKLAQKRAEGRGGWENPDECSIAFLSELLREHVAKGDPVDVGNLSMMIHQRGGIIE